MPKETYARKFRAASTSDQISPSPRKKHFRRTSSDVIIKRVPSEKKVNFATVISIGEPAGSVTSPGGGLSSQQQVRMKRRRQLQRGRRYGGERSEQLG